VALLGWPLLVVLGCLAVAVTLATFLLWSRLRGPRWAQNLVRLGLLGGCQLVAVLLVAAALNNYGYFYSSWSELLGRTSHNGRIAPAPAAPAANRSAARAGSSSAAASSSGQVQVLADPGWSSPAQRTSRGRVLSVRINGARSALSSHAFIYLPPQYYQKGYARRLFPAVQVFTGYPGGDLNLLNRLKYPEHLLADLGAHRAQPMVLVMLRPSVSFPRDTECTDVPDGPQALTFFAQDVPSATAATFRVKPTGWGAIGDSTGGYCAAKLAMTQSNVFTAAVALSGYFHALQDNTTGDLWANSTVLRNLNDLQWRLTHLPPPPIWLLLTTAPDERGPLGYAETRRFLRAARTARGALRVDTLILSHGGHNMRTWSAELPQALSWLSSRLTPKPPLLFAAPAG